jgi:AmmeMemoRadiSam system protein B
MFYPADTATLERAVSELLGAAPPRDVNAKAIIAPHAGYQYSGPTAAHAYRPSVDAFKTPLGNVMIDAEAVGKVLDLPGMQVSDEAHAEEHSLEVHLPFLQTVLDDFRLVPIVVGNCPAHEVEAALKALWGGEETLIVVSSDLSHFHSYADAREIDTNTTTRIEACEATLRGEEACGAYALNGLLLAAKAHGMRVNTLDVRNSGDTAGDKQRVVGYGAYALA